MYCISFGFWLLVLVLVSPPFLTAVTITTNLMVLRNASLTDLEVRSLNQGIGRSAFLLRH